MPFLQKTQQQPHSKKYEPIMTAKKVARAAVAVLKTRKTIMPDKNTASSIMLAKN